jgi:RHS repeat-associated protein
MSLCRVNRSSLSFSNLLQSLAYSFAVLAIGILVLQCTATASIRQIVSAQSNDAHCSRTYLGSQYVASCDPLPASVTVNASPTITGSKVFLLAQWVADTGDGTFQGSMGACTDNFGQNWVGANGQSVYIRPPDGATIAGITSVTCQTAFPPPPAFYGSTSTGKFGVLILQFFEVTGAAASDVVTVSGWQCSVVPTRNAITVLADYTGVVQNYNSNPNLGELGVLGRDSSGLLTLDGDDNIDPYSGSLILDTIYAAVGDTTPTTSISYPNAANCVTVTIPQISPGIDSGSNLGKCDECEGTAGNPINLTNGNVYIQQRDYYLPGSGPNLTIERTWNSLWPLSPHAGISTIRTFGDSWTSNYEDRIVFVDGNNIVDYWRPDGSKIRFTLSFISAGNYFYTATYPVGLNIYYSYNANTGDYSVNPGDHTRRHFNGLGQLTSIVDDHGNTTSLTYDDQLRLTRVTDSAARSITLNYEDPNNPNQATSIQDAAGVVSRYLYDSSGRLTKVTYADESFNSFNYDINDLILSVKDTDGKILEAHTYDAYKRGLTSERADGVEKVTVSYDSTGALATLTDSLGHVSQYPSTSITQKNHVTSVSGPGCATCGGRGNQSFIYDNLGHRTYSTDALGNQSSYTYETSGLLLTQSINVNGTPITWRYTHPGSVDDRLVTITDPLGNVTTNNYVTPQGNYGPDLLSTTTPAPDSRTAASVTSFTYNTKGQLLTVKDPLLHVTTFTYKPYGLVETVTDAQQKVTRFDYDLRGNRVSTTDALNQTTTFDYDSMNRLTAIHYPTTPATSTVFTYDNRGRRTSVTDANNKTTSYEYDDADRLVKVTDAHQGFTKYEYDTEDHLTRITDALFRDTVYEYDENGRLKKTTFPSGLIETYAYDALGNLTSKTDRKNQAITYGYDELRRLKHKQYPDGTAVDYTYDLNSRLTQVVDSTGTYRFTYDNMGRLTQTSTAYTFIPSKTFTVGYGWDAASNLASMTDPQGGNTTYTYDTLNRLSTLKNPQRNQFGFSYDALGRRTQLTRPNLVNTNYTYDSLSRLGSLLHQYTTSKGAKTTLDGATYSYDAAGNRLSRTDNRTNVTLNYGYDDLYQLSSVMQGSSTTESYSFDVVGNRLSSLGVSPYSYSSSNQLTEKPGTTYSYDDNGNLSSKTDTSGTTTSTWDYENRLARVTLPGGSQVSFKYDPMGRRIQKTSAAGTVNYVYDGANILEEVDSAGTLVTRYTQSAGIDEPLATLRSGTTSYYEADGLGSITSLSNSSGALANTYTYDSFGNPTASSGTIANPLRYTAREYDSETSLYYYRARYYDPQIGRFIGQDPVRFGSGVNFYAYVDGNPLSFTDPFGLANVGDVVFFNFHSSTSTVPDHVAIVSAVDALGYPTRAFGAWGNTMTYHEEDLSVYAGGIRGNMIGTGDMKGLTAMPLSDLMKAWAGDDVAPDWDGSRGKVCIDVVTDAGGYGGNKVRDAMREDFKRNRAKYKNFGAGDPNINDQNFFRRNRWFQQFLRNTQRYSSYR